MFVHNRWLWGVVLPDVFSLAGVPQLIVQSGSLALSFDRAGRP
jgi:hypothetical protein